MQFFLQVKEILKIDTFRTLFFKFLTQLHLSLLNSTHRSENWRFHNQHCHKFTHFFSFFAPSSTECEKSCVGRYTLKNLQCCSLPFSEKFRKFWDIYFQKGWLKWIYIMRAFFKRKNSEKLYLRINSETDTQDVSPSPALPSLKDLRHTLYFFKFGLLNKSISSPSSTSRNSSNYKA